MTYASASTAAIVRSGTARRRPVWTARRPKRAAPHPVTAAASTAARNVAVPAVESQLNVNVAPYGDALAVTGGVCAIALCSSGTRMRIVVESRTGADHCDPQITTSTTSRRYGAQARSSERGASETATAAAPVCELVTGDMAS